MASSKIETITKDLLARRSDYFNSIELVKECAEQEIPMSRKTIHNYIKDGLLPKPVHIGKEALFHKQYILGEIQAIYVLKSVFHVNYDDLKQLAKNKHIDFQDILPSIHTAVVNLQGNSKSKYKGRPLLVNLANDKVSQGVIGLLLKELKRGADIRKIDVQKFMFDSLDKV